MSSLIKTQEETSNELNLKLRKVTNKFNNSLINLEIMREEIEKINNNERLKTEKTEKLECKLRFLTISSRSFRNLSDYDENKEAKKATRKVMEKIDKFETKIRNVSELITDIIEYDYDKLINDLNIEKGT